MWKFDLIIVVYLMDCRTTFYELKSIYMNLLTQSNDDLKGGAVLQYRIARNLGIKHWIHEMRLNCQTSVIYSIAE